MVVSRYSLTHQSKSVDNYLLVVSGLLIIIGLVVVYDASALQALRDFGDSYYYIRQQLIWVVFGLMLGMFFTYFDYHKFEKYYFSIIIISIILLLAVFIPGLGISGGGAYRWLNLRLLTFQPSEIIKLTGAIFLAAAFSRGQKLKITLLVIILITIITALLQKDLGSSIVFLAMAGFMYFASGGSLLHFLTVIPLGVIAIIGLVIAAPYRMKRISAFLDPFSDTQGFTYHISQVLIALGSGGLVGLGLGQSRQKFEYIPEVTTDSIFAIIGEELGFVGGFLLICLFGLFIIRGLKIAQEAKDDFSKNLAIGLTSWIGIQAIINISSMVALLPLTGVPLPFISYGGSAIIVNIAALGLLLNISRRS